MIKSGRLPLLELESEGVQMIKSKGIDCLSIFLTPESEEHFRQRLITALTVTDEEVAARLEAARVQMEAAGSSDLFDYTLTNDKLEDAYQELVALISSKRPDIIPPVDEEAAASSAAAAAPRHPVLVVAGPSPAGRAALVAQLLTSPPFVTPAMVTDRKPAKGQVSSQVKCLPWRSTRPLQRSPT